VDLVFHTLLFTTESPVYSLCVTYFPLPCVSSVRLRLFVFYVYACCGCGAPLTFLALWLLISSAPSTYQSFSISASVLRAVITRSLFQPLWITAYPPAFLLIFMPANQSSSHAHILLCPVLPAFPCLHLHPSSLLEIRQKTLLFLTLCVVHSSPPVVCNSSH